MSLPARQIDPRTVRTGLFLISTLAGDPSGIEVSSVCGRTGFPQTFVLFLFFSSVPENGLLAELLDKLSVDRTTVQICIVGDGDIEFLSQPEPGSVFILDAEPGDVERVVASWN